MLAGTGAALVAAGWLWNLELPVIKKLWTSSMVLVSSGYCFLLMGAESETAKERLLTLKNSTDGFKIAEKDLEMRGSGDFFGTRQHGLPKLRIADILTDTKILMQTQELARELMEDKESFKKEENRQIARLVSKKINSLQVSNTANTI